jgi:hypothetical protein
LPGSRDAGQNVERLAGQDFGGAETQWMVAMSPDLMRSEGFSWLSK